MGTFGGARARYLVVAWAAICIALLPALGCAEAPSTDSPSTTSYATGSGGVGGGAAPTATPVLAPTPTSTPTAPPTQAPPEVSVTFVNAPLSARPGQATTLIARTSPNTGCTIEVDYKSGPSHAQGLVPKTSDAGGNVSWTWIVGTRTTPGQWPITVSCGSASNQTYINVT